MGMDGTKKERASFRKEEARFVHLEGRGGTLLPGRIAGLARSPQGCAQPAGAAQLF